MINEPEAEIIRTVFGLYLEHGNVRRVKAEADRLKHKSKLRPAEDGRMRGGRPLSRGYIYHLLGNPIYCGRIAHKGEVYAGLHEAIIDTETWEAVRTQLAGNAHDRRSGSGATESSLLAGRLHDERGNRLSPSHAVKSGARYRYYVSQALLQHRDGDAGSIVRIPAREIEGLVAMRLAAFLKDSGQVIDELGSSLAPRDQERLIVGARKLAERWPLLAAPQQRTFILHAVASVTVGGEEILIELHRTALRHALLGETSSKDAASATGSQARTPATGDTLTLRVPTRLKLCSGEMRLVIPSGYVQELQPRPNPTLIKALTRAHRWRQTLFTGGAPSTSAIAKEEGMTERYVSRILRLTFLAPDIVEAILDGYQPVDLELERLLKGIPIRWDAQLRALGFSRG